MEGQRPGSCQPRSKRGTSDGLGVRAEMAKGLKARHNGPAHGETWSRAFSPLANTLGDAQGWYETGPLALATTPASKLRPAKIPAHALHGSQTGGEVLYDLDVVLERLGGIIGAPCDGCFAAERRGERAQYRAVVWESGDLLGE